MSVKVGGVEFYVGPKALSGKDDLEQTIVDFINGAEKRLEIAVQELENEAIARAIIAARQRRVLVKLVIEQSYLRTDRARSGPRSCTAYRF